MPSFKQRSGEKELLDRDDIPFEDIKRNMEELDFINRHLGGHAITREGFRHFTKKGKLHILEIGCGGGDNLRAIKKVAVKINQQVRLTGVDINADCISFAKGRKGNDGIEFIQSDYKTLSLAEKPDLVFSSLFCHHYKRG